MNNSSCLMNCTIIFNNCTSTNLCDCLYKLKDCVNNYCNEESSNISEECINLGCDWCEEDGFRIFAIIFLGIIVLVLTGMALLSALSQIIGCYHGIKGYLEERKKRKITEKTKLLGTEMKNII